jgi:hypothetical protein
MGTKMCTRSPPLELLAREVGGDPSTRRAETCGTVAARKKLDADRRNLRRVDAELKLLLARMLERLHDHERRLQTLDVLASPLACDTHELLHRRRVAILELRGRGLTIDAIAKALSVSKGSVLQVVRGIPPPENARAVDGRRVGRRAQGHAPGRAFADG